MIGESYEDVMNRLILLAQVLADNADDINQCLSHITRVHSIAPILDPTAYRNGMGNLDDQASLLAPMAKAANVVAPIVERLRQKARDKAASATLASANAGGIDGEG